MPVSDTPEATARRNSNYRDYIHDQLQQERTATDHATILKKQAPARIRQMQAAWTAANLPPDPAGGDDLSHYHVVERMLDEQAYYPPHDKRTESPPMPLSTSR